MIDSHCHLADEAFHKDREEVLARAAVAGVERIVCIADTLSEAEKGREIAESRHADWGTPSNSPLNSVQIFYTAGVHPHNAASWKGVEDAVTVRALLAASPRGVAVGEIGLDYHYDNAPRDVQRSVFRGQVLIAKELGKPVVVHCREAIADVRDVLSETAIPLSKVVLHCCCEEWKDVADLVDGGVLLSFTGIATYPNAEAIRETIRQCPLSKFMVETDAPYLAPVPYRGKRNEPAYVVEVARCIAEVKGISLEEVSAETSKNAVEFFGFPS